MAEVQTILLLVAWAAVNVVLQVVMPLEGVVELAEEIFHMPVRLASPQAVSGMTEVVNNPIYATGVGLLIHGFRQMDLGRAPVLKGEEAPSLVERMKAWFTGHF